MKALNSIIVVVVLLLAGCADKVDLPQKPWSEGPYYKVHAYTDQYGVDFAEGWVRGEIGDRLMVERRVFHVSKKTVLVGAHIVRKDKTRFILPIYVHSTDESYRVRVIHLVDKADREFDFLRL